MSQQINLLNPALIKKKDFLNPNNIAITIGLLSITMLAYYSYAKTQVSTLTIERNQTAQALLATQEQLKQMAIIHAPRELDKVLFDQIAQLEHKEKIQQQVLFAVQQSSTSPDNGYAAIMTAFARQGIDGLWLTSFSMDSDTNKLNISGRTTQADLVPEYIANLGNEPVLQGKSFATLNMSLPKLNTNAAQPVTAVIDKETTQTTNLNFIDFSLQSSNDVPADSTTQKKTEGNL